MPPREPVPRSRPGQAGSPRPSGAGESSLKGAAGAQEEIARSLDRLADKLGAAAGPRDDESKKLSGQMAKAQELRERMEEHQQETRAARSGGRSPGIPGSTGSTGSAGLEGIAGSAGNQPGNPAPSRASNQAVSRQSVAVGPGLRRTGVRVRPAASPARDRRQESGPGGEVARLRDEYSRQLQETRELLDELRRDDRTFGQGGAGFTFEGQGMTLSAPGTESFKQDFAKWDELRKQATQALELAESSIAKKLQTNEARDRLASGVDDRPPAEYTQQVDSYFKALAGKKSR